MPDIPSRIVPGAPPSTAPSKTQKKKRKTGKKDGEDDPQTPAAITVEIPDAHAAALTDKAPRAEDVKQGAVADDLLAHSKEPTGEVKSSPVVDLLNKRMKALGKKITRIHTYSGKPVSELNEDQKKTLATLPSLEAVRKELEEAKAAVEALEAEQASEKARRRVEAEEAERQRIAEAVAAAQAQHLEQTMRILDLIRLRSIVSGEEPETVAPTLAPPELEAIRLAGNVLLLQEPEHPVPREDVLLDLLTGQGEIATTPHARLFEIVDSFFNSQLEEALEAEAVAEVAEEIVQELAEEIAEELAIEELSNVISGLPDAPGLPAAMNFMQESELDDPMSFDNEAEWVEKEPEEGPVVTRQLVVEEDSTGAVTVTETTEVHVHSSEQSALDWAEDEGGLPSIDGLHASFGTSSVPPPATESHHDQPNGHTHPTNDDDGFMQARSGRERSRGRGRGGFRGERGSFRGGERGAFRGGDRGFRGERGSSRGGRGGRGRPHQDGESGNWRGGDGERGRGRGGRGRGGFDRDRGTRGGRGGASGNPE